MHRRISFLVLTLFFAVGSFLTPAMAQVKLADGWRELDATKFIEHVGPILTKLSNEEEALVTQHGWDHFLSKPDVIAKEEWSTVHELLTHIGCRCNLLVVGDAKSKRAASQRRFEIELKALKARVLVRLADEPKLINDIEFGRLGSLNLLLSHAERAAVYAQWMDNNDWRNATLAQQAHLYEVLNVGQVDRKRFSARWSGTFRAPATGQYVFSQLRQYNEDADIKIWIDGQLVLGFTPPVNQEAASEALEVEAGQFRSKEVALTEGQVNEIRVELSHDVVGVGLRTRYPMAVVLWESEKVERQVIPVGSFSPPVGFGDPGVSGLKGEYYSDTDHKELKATQLDPGLQMIWNNQEVANLYRPKCQEIFDHCRPTLFARGAELGGVDDMRVRGWSWTRVIDKFLKSMPANQRSLLIADLARQPHVLKALERQSMRQLLSNVYMLPGTEHLELLGRWGEAREQPKNQLGRYPRGSRVDYFRSNYRQNWLLGRLVSRDFFHNTVQLWDEHLERGNGECNLAVAYMTIFSAKIDRQGREIRRRLDEKLADESMTGDQRMTWLLARGYAEEVLGSREPRAERGLPYAEEAYMVAVGPTYRFWALQELTSRMASLGQIDQANALLDSAAKQFSEPDQRLAVKQWRRAAASLKTTYDKLRKEKEAGNLAVNAAYAAELKRRLTKAQQRQDKAGITLYQKRIEAMQAKPSNPTR